MKHQDPKFGYDGLGPLLQGYPPVLPGHRELEAVTTTVQGADALGDYTKVLPAGLSAYFSYVDNYGGWSQLLEHFPDIPEWWGKPWAYTSASSMQQLLDVAGNRDFVKAAAHYGMGPHICAPSVCGYPQVDWTQWDDKGAKGENIDRWLGNPDIGHPLPALVSITIFGDKAHFADIEPGAMHISDFPHWYDNIALKPKPVSPKPVPTPPKPPVQETVVAINTVIDKNDVVHVVQETSSGKVYHVRQVKQYGAWAGGATLILDNGNVPKRGVEEEGEVTSGSNQ